MMKRKHSCILMWQTILAVGLACVLLKTKRQLYSEKKNVNKYSDLYKLMAQWIEAAQNGQFIAEWMKKNKYMSVAIYGMSLIGERLYVELTDREIQVAYGIDRLSREYLDGIKMYKPSDVLPMADAVIVTAIHDFEEIKEQLRGKVNCPIISFRDIVNELLIQ